MASASGAGGSPQLPGFVTYGNNNSNCDNITGSYNNTTNNNTTNNNNTINNHAQSYFGGCINSNRSTDNNSGGNTFGAGASNEFSGSTFKGPASDPQIQKA